MTQQSGEEPKGTRRLLGLGRRTVLPLAIASTAPIGMLLVRTIYTHNTTHRSLLWNLFLAWIPLLLAILAWRSRQYPVLTSALGFMWLLFLPNTLYLVTDLVHLSPTSETTMWWFDLGMLFSFSFVGIALGLHSLHLIQGLVNWRFGVRIGWIFTLTVSVLTGFGIYIGRFLRWNSWDLFLHPVNLTSDVLASFTSPGSLMKMITIVPLFGAVTIVGLLMIPAHRTTK